MSIPPEIPVRVAPRRALADECALVLVAEGLSVRVRHGPEGFVLHVPAEQAERAAAALAAYESENRSQAFGLDQPSGSWSAGLAVALALLLFFLITGPRDPALRWFARGSADAERILAGELWRTVTALTLHADVGHALANALVGAFFLGATCRSLGAGLGCALVLLAGAAGNLGNALLHRSFHVSVGASTAVFGAVGVLVGLAVFRRRWRRERRRAWLPVAAGLALLAMLGVGTERVDIWAHLLGLLAGGGLGSGVGLVVRARPGRWVQAFLGGAALALVGGCWFLALR